MRIPLDEAQRIVFENKVIPETEEVHLTDANGRVLAKPIFAQMSQPPFRRSAMDGYAIRKKDFYEGVILPVVDEVDAGDTRTITLPEGAAIRIMTGAHVPDGADLVIRQEDTDYGERNVTVYRMPKFDNIARVGEDFMEGDLLADGDICLQPGAMACLAAAGIEKVEVYRRLKVAILVTGSELISPGEERKEGQIFDSNLVYLQNRLEELRCEIVACEHIADEEEEIISKLKEIKEKADYIITTGGVSVGKKDLMEPVIHKVGGEVLFHGVALKPGMPTMFSMWDGVPVLSLSGNPFAAVCLFEFLFPYQKRIRTGVPMKEKFGKARPNLKIVRGFFDGTEVEIFAGQKNGSTREGALSNCFVELPAGNDSIEAGTKVYITLM